MNHGFYDVPFQPVEEWDRGSPKLCPNEKMVDVRRVSNVHGCVGMDKSFQSYPVSWAHPEHTHRNPGRVNITDYRQRDVYKGLLTFQP